MERWNNCVAVVTGASSGIGAAIAKDLVKAGLRVVALARRQERLDQIRSQLPEERKSRFFYRKCDVTNEADVKAVFKWIETTLGGTDILVNNAGVYRQGNLLDIDVALMDKVLDTNVRGLVLCTQEAFKSMTNRNFNGHIVHMNSIGGHKVFEITTGSTKNIYSATKFAVTAINETIRNELRNLGTKIKTTSISPGIVRTELAPKELFDSIGISLNVEDVSQAVMFALSTPPHVQIHELILKPVGEVL